MSAAKRRRHREKLARRAAAAEANGFRADANYAVQAAWCASASDLAEARQRTHDGLVEQLGDRREGGVSWRWWHGAEADDALRKLRSGSAPPALAEHYAEIGKRLERGGYLVVAMAEAKHRERTEGSPDQ